MHYNNSTGCLTNNQNLSLSNSITLPSFFTNVFFILIITIKKILILSLKQSSSLQKS